MYGERSLRGGRESTRRRRQRALVALCQTLGAESVVGVSREERELLASAEESNQEVFRPERVAAAIERGEDPLGAIYIALRRRVERHRRGATYTPIPIVEAMVEHASRELTPDRVVDPGTGSGRFLCAAGRRFSRARLVGVETDPLAALVARAHLNVLGMSGRARVELRDFRAGSEPDVGQTLFVGNPPYVRHQCIEAEWKRWLTTTADRYGLPSSQRAGLHVHFYLATLAQARRGDVGIFVTSSEWLDVNYGALVRELLLGPLGLTRLDVFPATVKPYPGALTTAAIATFRVGEERPAVRCRSVGAVMEELRLEGGRELPRTALARTRRWSSLFSSGRSGRDSGLVELGEICRVHRGGVTGCNRVWLVSPEAPQVPERFRVPAVTRARELFDSSPELRCDRALRRLICLPEELTGLSSPEREQVERFLTWARHHGADRTYIARHRAPWWRVRLRSPAPIIATYMARRPPVFVRNRIGAAHINIAHGIYPREPLAPDYLDRVDRYLSNTVSLGDGRTYAGGLTKFEPGEMARLLVPAPGGCERPTGGGALNAPLLGDHGREATTILTK